MGQVHIDQLAVVSLQGDATLDKQWWEGQAVVLQVY